MRMTLLLALFVFLTGCNREDTLKFIPDEESGVTINLQLTPAPYYSGDHGQVVGHCDNAPTTGCTVTELDPTCSFSCAGTATIVFTVDDSCLEKKWNIPMGEYQESGDDFIYQTTGNESLISIEAETELWCG